jgi:hypothetical protein
MVATRTSFVSFASGGGSLTYDPGTYTYVWKTAKANTCRQLVVRFVNGLTVRASFMLK